MYIKPIYDQVFLAIAAWKEAEGEGLPGQQAVMNVFINRAKADGKSIYFHVTQRLQVSSLTSAGDPRLIVWGVEGDPTWERIQSLAVSAANNELDDVTEGAVDYYNPSAIKTTQSFKLPDGTGIAFPDGWNANAVQYVKTIGKHVFFRAV